MKLKNKQNRKNNSFIKYFYLKVLKVMTISQLYQNYREKRPISWGVDIFTLLVEFFPSLVVIFSDGTFDQKEKSYLEKLIHSLGFFFEEEGYSEKKSTELQLSFSQEFQYLATELNYWQNDFLDALQDYLEKNPHQKDFIQTIIAWFAQVSVDITEDEQNAIDFLVEKLKL
jgi:hypothetical protein